MFAMRRRELSGAVRSDCLVCIPGEKNWQVDLQLSNEVLTKNLQNSKELLCPESRCWLRTPALAEPAGLFKGSPKSNRPLTLENIPVTSPSYSSGTGSRAGRRVSLLHVWTWFWLSENSADLKQAAHSLPPNPSPVPLPWGTSPSARAFPWTFLEFTLYSVLHTCPMAKCLQLIIHL